MRKLRFGDRVYFDREYRSSKPRTVDLQLLGPEWTISDIEKEFSDKNIELLEHIPVKKVDCFKAGKVGIFLGEVKIHTSIYYDYAESGYGGAYTVHKEDFVTAGEIRCEGIKRPYFVPMEAIYPECECPPESKTGTGTAGANAPVEEVQVPPYGYAGPYGSVLRCPRCRRKHPCGCGLIRGGFGLLGGDRL